MGKIDTAVAWALSIAQDDSHGYDQGSRWGPDYDCSSLVIQAYQNAGVPVKTNGASYTGDMVDAFLATGFKDVTSQITLSSGSGLKKGDVVWKSGHVEMVSRPGYLVGASINENGETTGGATGDQTGKEIRERTYYNYPWTKVLRWPEKETDVEVPSPISSNKYLSMADMERNATYIWWYLGARGWSANAVAGMLGNMQVESTINPGLWESLDEGNTSGGVGLVQWTPATRHLSWCEERGLNYSAMDSNLKHLEYEVNDGDDYYPTANYPETFAEFKVSTKSPTYLAMAFLANYERPKNPDQPIRGEYAEYWYQFIMGLNFKQKRKGLPLWMMFQATKRRV